MFTGEEVFFSIICRAIVTGHLKMHHQFCLKNYFYNGFSRVQKKNFSSSEQQNLIQLSQVLL